MGKCIFLKVSFSVPHPVLLNNSNLDLNTRTDKGMTAENGLVIKYTKILLIASGVVDSDIDMNVRNNQGITALMMICTTGHI